VVSPVPSATSMTSVDSARSAEGKPGHVTGAAVCGRIIAWCWPSRRRWLLLALCFEIISVAAAASLTQTLSTSHIRDNIVLALLGAAMGSQNAVARQLSIKDLHTSVITGLLTGLVAVTLPAKQNSCIPRRLMAIAALIVGAFSGALTVARWGLPVTLVLSMGVLAAATAIFSADS
jgi:uncharacterized membrane protein YoaK (UPF0700 family)